MEAFRRIELAQHIMLMPCCLPAKADPRSPKELYEVAELEERHTRWTEYLRREVGCSATLTKMEAILGEGRTVILGSKGRS